MQSAYARTAASCVRVQSAYACSVLTYAQRSTVIGRNCIRTQVVEHTYAPACVISMANCVQGGLPYVNGTRARTNHFVCVNILQTKSTVSSQIADLELKMAFEQVQATVSSMLHGINRYNPENLQLLEQYVEIQVKENQYDLEANLAILKLYQLNPAHFKVNFAALILLKAMTNLPHTDFILCKCLIDSDFQQEEPLFSICYFASLLETCHFKSFWQEYDARPSVVQGVAGFNNAIRKFICHVINSTYQTIEMSQLRELLGVTDDTELKRWMASYDWKELEGDQVFIGNQEESVKTKNITEKIGFENVASVMKISQ